MGGIYIMDGYYIDKSYFNELQKRLFTNIINMAENNFKYEFTISDIKLLKDMLLDYSKPLL